jgi:hypothetical protein
VVFLDGAVTLGVGTLNANDQVTFTTSSLTVGKHSIIALYGGDADFLGMSAVLTQTVNAVPRAQFVTAPPGTAVGQRR